MIVTEDSSRSGVIKQQLDILSRSGFTSAPAYTIADWTESDRMAVGI